ncbi:MAG TPA: hypothetical protein VJT50_12820 [Pyrinomonadaceae bacterium]|nr:hypothetical protein [Pyrinomonadaceae bacterium]
MKHVFGSCCAFALLIVIGGLFSSAYSQSASATPDPFVTQLTSSPIGAATNQFTSFATDISADGRFVVFESNGNIATFNPNNADGNREIFLLDYAQRRIFQLTNTKNVPKASATPSPSPSPSPSPTPTPSPTPADSTQVQIEISNNRPMISFAPSLVSGKRTYTIVFSSNAPNPANFDGTSTTALAADANQEIWIYQLPAVADEDLTAGNDVFQDLTTGTFTQVTSTAASAAPRPGDASTPPFVADDNREAAINDEGNIIAFISTRSLVGTANNDGNPELFFRNLGAAPGTFVQGTNTADAVDGVVLISRFQQNPSLSADGTRVAFISTANLAGTNDDNGHGKGNAEIYLADFTGAGLSNIKQVTKTKSETTGTFTGASVNLLSPGRRLSRDGGFLTFESRATDPKADSATNSSFLGTFVYNVGGDSFTEVGPRPLLGTDIRHLPTFTDYTGTVPGSLIFASALNFKTDGTFPAAGQESTGLNPNNQPQIFITTLPVSSTSTFKRLTNNPIGSLASDIPLRPLPSASRKRIAFTLTAGELGGGNADGSIEAYYLVSPTVTTELSGTPLTFFAAASNYQVVDAPPVASPSPSPTPTPTPGTIAAGLAPGEMAIVRSTVPLAPSDKIGAGGSETERVPIYPIELNGVSLSINGAAAGLSFVGNSSKEIDFVVPPGLTPGVATVVINNNGTVIRGTLNIIFAQPDIFSSTHDAGGRAVICNVTNTAVSGCVLEPFNVTSANSSGTLVATVLEIHVTGVRGLLPSEVSVTIGTTNIVPSSVRPNRSLFGEDLITITLPASLAGAGDVPVIVSATRAGTTFQSRGTATAPKTHIN